MDDAQNEKTKPISPELNEIQEMPIQENEVEGDKHASTVDLNKIKTLRVEDSRFGNSVVSDEEEIEED